MKSQSKNKKISNNNNINQKLNTIEVEPTLRFRNELFQRLFINNNINIINKAQKDRISSHGNLHAKKKLIYHRSPEVNRGNKKIPSKIKNSSYLIKIKNNNNNKELKISNSTINKKENNNFLIPNTNSAKLIKSNKITRPINSSSKKFKNYPNLIRGVLHQVKYYNLNKNINYNDTLRYKPIDDFFNEQSSTPIFLGNIMENNTNSPNNSLNLDFKQEQKYNNQTNSSDNYINNIRKMETTDDDNNKVYLEKEIKPRNLIFRKKVEDNYISPIKERKSVQFDCNDIVNEDPSNRNSIDNYDNLNKSKKKNNNIENNDNYHILYLRSRNREKIMPSETSSIRAEHYDKSDNSIVYKKKGNRPQFEFIKENIDSFNIKSNIFNKNKDIERLELCSGINFIINEDKIMNKNFNNLKLTKTEKFFYKGKKVKIKINKGPNYDSKGNLLFTNDEEVLRYIKKKIIEEKNLIYNYNKMKYNYFILSKQFHGKLLYEIGLENNLNKINTILEKENVEVEHKPIMIIFKKDFSKIKNNESLDYNYNINNNLLNNEEIDNLILEKEKITKENKNLLKKFELLNNEKEYNKLSEEVKKLNETNKEKERKLNEIQKLLNKYELKLRQYNDENKILQSENEKYAKYIYEIQEYNQKIIIEYQNMISQLESEIEKYKNKIMQEKHHFNTEILNIISSDYFFILNIKNNEKIQNNEIESKSKDDQNFKIDQKNND